MTAIESPHYISLLNGESFLQTGWHTKALNTLSKQHITNLSVIIRLSCSIHKHETDLYMIPNTYCTNNDSFAKSSHTE